MQEGNNAEVMQNFATCMGSEETDALNVISVLFIFVNYFKYTIFTHTSDD